MLQRALKFSLSKEVREGDTPLAVASVARNPLGRDLTWDFVRANWDEFYRRYGEGGFILARIVSTATEDFTTLDKAREVEDFFRSNLVEAAKRSINQSVERIRSNALWLERDGEAIASWLSESKWIVRKNG